MNDKFEHAWRYFELHANQRIALFRYYAIFFTLYVTGVGYLSLKIHTTGFHALFYASCISAVFALITLIFWLLDDRNRFLIKIAENALMSLEKKFDNCEEIKIFTLEYKASKKQLCMHENSWSDKRLIHATHTCCLNLFFSMAIFCAVVIGFYSVEQKEALSASYETTNSHR